MQWMCLVWMIWLARGTFLTLCSSLKDSSQVCVHGMAPSLPLHILPFLSYPLFPSLPSSPSSTSPSSPSPPLPPFSPPLTHSYTDSWLARTFQQPLKTRVAVNCLSLSERRRKLCRKPGVSAASRKCSTIFLIFCRPTARFWMRWEQSVGVREEGVRRKVLVYIP